MLDLGAALQVVVFESQLKGLALVLSPVGNLVEDREIGLRSVAPCAR
jgi:hypothetical protein